MRPLPRFSGPAARIGTEIHRWIERRAAGQGRLLEADDAVDLTQEELAGDPGRVERLRQAFLTSRFADRAPLFAERAFLLRVGAFAVSGRIDAIYGEPDGPWEIVDWKTGVGAADPLQLELYGLACVEIWHKAPEDLTLTYYYLARDEAVSHPMGDPDDGARARRRRRSRRSDAASFEPTPGRWCALLRLQGVLRDRPRLARRERLAFAAGVEPLELLVERPVPGRGIEPADDRARARTAPRGPTPRSRACLATARNHSRLPGLHRDGGPRCRGAGATASSTATRRPAERVGERRATSRHSAVTVTSRPSHDAVATDSFCSSSGS